jgi:hypothetical protein
MTARKAAAALAAVAAAVAAVISLRRLRARRRARVDLYFGDGSLVSLREGTPEGDRLLALSRQVLSAARS